MGRVICDVYEPYDMVHIIKFWIQFQVCDDIMGNNLDFGVSIFGQSHVMQGRKSDFNMVQQNSWYLWPCYYICLKFMTDDFMFCADYNFSSKSVFSKVKKLNLIGTSILVNGSQYAFPVRSFELGLIGSKEYFQLQEIF